MSQNRLCLVISVATATATSGLQMRTSQDAAGNGLSPPPAFTPYWTAHVPNKTNESYGYPLLAPDQVVHTYVYEASPSFGEYNHGPMISFWDGVYWMEWYNGVQYEGVENRVLYATSKDAITWSKPAVMFNTTGKTGLENEPHLEIDGRRYAVGGSWDVFARTGGGSEHTGPDTAMLRRVYSATTLGPVCWLGKEVPAGYEQFNYPVCSDAAKVDAQTVADAAAYVAALLDLEPVSDYGKPNERVLYELPGSDRRRLIMMLRSGESHVGHAMLASTCELETGAEPDPPPPNETMHFCRPGTGLYNAGLVGDRMPQNGQQQQQLQQQRERRQQEGKEEGGSGSEDGKGGQPQPPWPGYHPVPVGRHCNWTTPVVTNVPDSHSRACTAPLPDGRIFLIGAQIPKTRDPIVLSLSSDGLNFDRAWAVRVNAPPPKYNGYPGFQYPAAMWKLDGPRGPEIIFSYSVNKEDIALSRVPLSVLD